MTPPAMAAQNHQLLTRKLLKSVQTTIVAFIFILKCYYKEGIKIISYALYLSVELSWIARKTVKFSFQYKECGDLDNRVRLEVFSSPAATRTYVLHVSSFLPSFCGWCVTILPPSFVPPFPRSLSSSFFTLFYIWVLAKTTGTFLTQGGVQETFPFFVFRFSSFNATKFSCQLLYAIDWEHYLCSFSYYWQGTLVARRMKKCRAVSAAYMESTVPIISIDP